jgi:hypothetical protein
VRRDGIYLMTDQLEVCDVFLPPEVLLDVRAKAAEGVVRVHHHMNNRVDQSTKDGCRGFGGGGGAWGTGVEAGVCMGVRKEGMWTESYCAFVILIV